MKTTAINEDLLIQSMEADYNSIEILGEYLGYEVGKNPVNPESEIRIFFTNKLDSKDKGVIAVIPEQDLTQDTKTIQIRKLYEKVLDIKNEKLGSGISVVVIGFVGKHRLVFFPTVGGNRDTRLDLTPETINIELYKNDFNYLKNDKVMIEESPFGYGSEIKVNDKAFKRQLSDHFLGVVSLYRKKLSEWITATDLKKELENLVSEQAKKSIKDNDISCLAQSSSYKSVLSTVVDTIILRQLMRRFLEGYYGADSFDVNDIALGVGGGTLDEAIIKATNIAKSIGDEREIQKLNRAKTQIQSMDLFTDFTDDEKKATSSVEIKKGKKEYISNLSQKATKQFQLAYGGDLFAGSIGNAATKIENRLAKERQEDWVKFYADTKAGNYSFRYEDIPPEAIERQYEDSMSQNVQITLDRKTKQPIVFYGSDVTEQKNKGAYYTDQKLVTYMIDRTVAVEFNNRYKKVREAIKNKNLNEIDNSLKNLLDLKIADFTSGGGSFLRGAFLKLAEQYNLINDLNYPEEIRNKYDFLRKSEDSQYKWENYILNHMIYGVDVDYKAIIISSLTLTLSSLEHRPKNTKLPQLIGRTLIHQNSLINSVPYYERKKIFSKYQKEIAELRKLKETDFSKFLKLKDSLQDKVIPEAGKISDYASILHIESLELNLPEVYFNEDGTINENGGMDIVVGNPPWEIWKPNADEFFSEYDESYRSLPNNKRKKELENKIFAKMPEVADKWEAERQRIQAGSQYFRSKKSFLYQTWKVNNQKASSDINLYKISLERFTQLAKPNARFSILVPDNFATDNGSSGLRHLVIDHYTLKEFLSFENSKGIFEAVHRSYKFACLSFDSVNTNKSSYFSAFFYKKDLEDLNCQSKKIKYSFDFLKEIEPERYAMVEPTSSTIFELFKKIRRRFLPLQKTNFVSWRRDFDKTNDVNLFNNKLSNKLSNDDIPLYEGKCINQFEIKPSKIKYSIKKNIVEKKVGLDYKYYRIAIRAVASSTNKRSLIGTLLPPETSSVNSLLTQKEPQLMEIDERLFILGMLNSYVIDFVLRQLISMNVNQIYLKQLPVPSMLEIHDSELIIQIVKELLKENEYYYKDLDSKIPGNKYKDTCHIDLTAELNARIMLDFCLKREDILNLMSTFESSKHAKEVKQETQKILDYYDKLVQEKK